MNNEHKKDGFMGYQDPIKQLDALSGDECLAIGERQVDYVQQQTEQRLLVGLSMVYGYNALQKAYEKGAMKSVVRTELGKLERLAKQQLNLVPRNTPVQCTQEVIALYLKGNTDYFKTTANEIKKLREKIR